MSKTKNLKNTVKLKSPLLVGLVGVLVGVGLTFLVTTFAASNTGNRPRYVGGGSCAAVPNPLTRGQLLSVQASSIPNDGKYKKIVFTWPDNSWYAIGQAGWTDGDAYGDFTVDVSLPFRSGDVSIDITGSKSSYASTGKDVSYAKCSVTLQ